MKFLQFVLAIVFVAFLSGRTFGQTPAILAPSNTVCANGKCQQIVNSVSSYTRETSSAVTSTAGGFLSKLFGGSCSTTTGGLFPNFRPFNGRFRRGG